MHFFVYYVFEMFYYTNFVVCCGKVAIINNHRPYSVIVTNLKDVGNTKTCVKKRSFVSRGSVTNKQESDILCVTKNSYQILQHFFVAQMFCLFANHHATKNLLWNILKAFFKYYSASNTTLHFWILKTNELNFIILFKLWK